MSNILFLKLALEKLLKEAGKKNTALRDSCKAALEKIGEEEKKNAKGKGPSGNETWGLTADTYFLPFKLACETKNARIIETALDWLQKLIAYGYLRSDEDNNEERLMDVVVETICNCYQHAQTNEKVQLQMLKAILPAVTSSTCHIHGDTLLTAVRTVYNIYLVSRTAVNQSTAKVTLQQMVEVVFQRMELAAAAAASGEGGAGRRFFDGNDSAAETVSIADIHDDVIRMQEVEEEGDGGDVAKENGVAPAAPTSADGRSAREGNATEGSGGEKEAVGKEGDNQPEAGEEVGLEEGDGAKESKEQAGDEKGGGEEGNGKVDRTTVDGATGGPGAARGKYGFCVVCGKPANNYSLQTRKPLCSVTCRDRHVKDTPVESTAIPPVGMRSGAPLDVLCFDALKVFKALCKRSARDLPSGASADSVDMRSKILSLELLLSILNNAGPAFREGERFIAAVKQYLCGASLLKNGVSPIPAVFGLSLSIFKTLIARFKDHLKAEIGIFFSNIPLYILESQHTSAQQKWMVLEVLSDICRHPQTIVDIFLNYDCDIKGMNLFERIVDDVAKVAQGQERRAAGGGAPGESPVELLGLTCLVAILKSLVEWSKDQGAEPRMVEAGRTQLNGDFSGLDPEDEDVMFPSAAETEIAENGPLNKSLKRTEEDDLDSPGVFEKRKQVKLVIQQGIDKFNTKPKKGIQFLIDEGHLENDPVAVCRFLMSHELHKDKIGEYLGEGDEFNQAVMHCWVDTLDFSGRKFVPSLRYFLSGFRLPGEAQKIDRMMLKYAERYCLNNPGAFATADAAYVLAFATIMLNTDLHSPQIRRKMTKPDFLKMNRGINDGDSLPDEFLSDIYDEISTNEIKLNDLMPESVGPVPDKSRRLSLYKRETEVMIEKSKNLFKKSAAVSEEFYVATHVEHAKLMFQTSWYPMLAVLSVLLENSEDEKVISLCLEGFRCAIRVSSIFFLETERDAFVSSLAKFTYLNNLREMRPKNIESIKTLISIAHSEGNFLLESWQQVLKSISQLERLQIIGAGGKAFDSQEPPPTPSPAKSKRRGERTHQDIEAANSLSIATNIDASAIDRIFTGSTELNDVAIVEFVKQLCVVAKDEVSSADGQGVFLMQKIVDVAYYNMGRIRFVWAKMWVHMADIINEIGCHPKRYLVDMMIDLLKQLALKFLEIDELTNFNFQKHFLKPFEHIMTNNHDTAVRDMIIACLTQIILTRANNIKSGWKSIFVIFSEAAAEAAHSTIQMGFEIVERVLQDCFTQTTEFYVDCINCLMDYGRQEHFPEISLRAIDYVHFCARELAEGHVTSLKLLNEGEVLFTDADDHIKYWWPLLVGLSGLVSHPTPSVRTKALQVLFDVLKSYGKLFSASLWDVLFRGILFPIFDDVRHSSDLSAGSSEWLDSTCLNALRALVDLFSHYFSRLGEPLLNDVIDLLTSCILQDNESLARIGVTCFLQLISENGRDFSHEVWTSICDTIKRLFEETAPQALLKFGQPQVDSATGDENAEGTEETAAASGTLPQSDLNFHHVIVKCVVQLLLLQAVNDMVFALYSQLSTKHLRMLLDCLHRSYEFSSSFNADMELRVSLLKAGFMKQLPNLLKQETNAVSCSLRILFRAYEEIGECEEDPEFPAYVETLLLRQVRAVVLNYQALNPEKSREVVSWTPIVVLVLNGLVSFSDESFQKHMPELYVLLVDMMRCDRREVREVLRQVFLRVGRVFAVTATTSAATSPAASAPVADGGDVDRES